MTETTDIEPIFISVKKTALVLDLTIWSVYRLCDSGELESQYHGKRRLVRYDSVKRYADSLPTTKDAG